MRGRVDCVGSSALRRPAIPCFEGGGLPIRQAAPLKNRFSIVGDVRGSGLFLGIELVKDRDTLEPTGQEASFIADRMREQGVLLATDGPYHNVVKTRPPMPFSENDVSLLAGTMEKFWSRISARRKF